MRNSAVAFLGRLLGRNQSLSRRADSLSADSAGPRVSMQAHLFVAAGLCVLALLLRLPWYFVDVIDKDESTFVLLGRVPRTDDCRTPRPTTSSRPSGTCSSLLIQLLVPHSLTFVRLPERSWLPHRRFSSSSSPFGSAP